MATTREGIDSSLPPPLAVAPAVRAEGLEKLTATARGSYGASTKLKIAASKDVDAAKKNQVHRQPRHRRLYDGWNPTHRGSS